MHIVPIKALSVNAAWQGRRFKTDAYKKFERDVLKCLPGLTVPPGKLSLFIEFGYSSKQADFDNGLKPFIDCLQKKYGFNDNQIKRSQVIVNNEVKKGHEYIKFAISALDKAA
jgi:Holliday junction resolvase RusA-like endonuclease